MLDQFFGADGVQVVGLSHRLAPGEVCHYPGDPPYRLQPVTSFDSDGYALNYVSVGEHTGTHWGAPRHFNEGAAAADELEAEDFFLPGVMIDVQRQAENDDDYAVTVDDLEAWESVFGPFPHQCAVILNTGWHKRWPTARFANLDDNGVPRHPGFSVEAVRWLLRRGALGHRGALGTDAFSPDVGVDETFAVSKLLYREHRISLEVLANLDRLPARGFWLAVGGFINAGGTGSPATVYALRPNGVAQRR
ncbi:cyclase family protein [Mycobacterium sp. SM1]|uniref:cyclase family protein n=1 Tax=Mycobacterium sp. SM1 TaxID=2816243 RepID=UPI001BD10C68|nr:cyclase family protein [Mycobacterium sp. SM1]MBS4730560.1 cyclase family protein [Mycobacterium sp. SM1]